MILRDVCLGTTARVSVSASGGDPDGEASFPKISGNKAVVVYHSTATNLVPADTNGVLDNSVRVLSTSTTERVSTDTAGNQANGQTGYATVSQNKAVVVFHGLASNLVAGDTNAQQDVFVKFRTTNVALVVSATEGNAFPNGLSGSGYASSNGQYVVFHSDVFGVVAADTNAERDVFLRRTP